MCFVFLLKKQKTHNKALPRKNKRIVTFIKNQTTRLCLANKTKKTKKHRRLHWSHWWTFADINTLSSALSSTLPPDITWRLAEAVGHLALRLTSVFTNICLSEYMPKKTRKDIVSVSMDFETLGDWMLLARSCTDRQLNSFELLTGSLHEIWVLSEWWGKWLTTWASSSAQTATFAGTSNAAFYSIWNRTPDSRALWPYGVWVLLLI